MASTVHVPVMMDQEEPKNAAASTSNGSKTAVEVAVMVVLMLIIGIASAFI